MVRFSFPSILLVASIINKVSAFSSPTAGAYKTIQSSNVLNPWTNEISSPLKGNKKKSLVILLPQLGEFDSSEYVEHLVAASDALEKNDISLKVIGIGNEKAALQFCNFTGLAQDALCIDLNATLYKELGLYDGPGWDLPDFVSDDLLKFLLSTLPGGTPKDESQLRPVGTAWLNYLLMCAGIGAKGTISEILRGYFGDYNAPERFKNDDVVKAGFITIGPGVGPVKIMGLKYNQWFADEKGYQRPVELATVRLKNMVEVLTKWDTYVSNPLTISQRGATYLFDSDGNELYSYKTPGVLTYSETMARPLTFLSPYIGEDIARNPLGLPDTGRGELVKGRGILKPAGKAMGFLSFIFKLENKLQAQLLGAEESDFAAARKEIESEISSDKVVIYTYDLSPFSAEAIAVLDEIGATYKNIEIGLEWFLLDKEKSTKRAELLEMTGQSSLPSIFIDGKHIGGLFTGTPDGKLPGLAGLKESGDLKKMLA